MTAKNEKRSPEKGRTGPDSAGPAGGGDGLPAAGAGAAPAGPAAAPQTEKKRFNEEAFAADVALGHESNVGLAAKHGISVGYVSEIIGGRKRPRIAEMVAELQYKRRRGIPISLGVLQFNAISTLARVMRTWKSKPAPAIAAAREVLSHTLMEPEAQPEREVVFPLGLTAEDYENLAKMRGGPTNDGPAEE